MVGVNEIVYLINTDVSTDAIVLLIVQQGDLAVHVRDLYVTCTNYELSEKFSHFDQVPDLQFNWDIQNVPTEREQTEVVIWVDLTLIFCLKTGKGKGENFTLNCIERFIVTFKVTK